MSHLNIMTEAGSSTTRQRVRLTKEGSIFLSNYIGTVNSYPLKTEKEAILATLRTIPGNEAFTIEKLNSWLTRHRKPSRDQHVLLDDETILFPKLTPVHLQQLRVLYRKKADPPEGIITFWAGRIHADRAEVVAWIQYQQEKAKENNVGATPESPDMPLRELVGDSASDSASVSPITSELRPHLPTPATSLSPSISPRTRMPSLPPIAVKLEENRRCLSPVSSLDTPSLQMRPASSYMHSNGPRSALEGLPPSSRLQQMPMQRAKLSPVAISIPNSLLRVGGKTSRRDSNTMLAATIRDSLRPDASPSEQPPRSVDEFTEKFQEVENMIGAFMKKYDSGQLVRLGWDSSHSKAAS